MKAVQSLAVLLVLCGCRLGPRGNGDAYSVRGDPWAEGTETSSSEASRGATPPEGADAAAPGRGPVTVLEQLDEARGAFARLEADHRQLEAAHAALTALVEELKKENANLAAAMQSDGDARARFDQELAKARSELSESQARCRALADEVLAERIQRIRVERELIQAKIAEAEHADGGS
jgi:predicted RNase H-like nuclease (RuvC/YqgF family)